MCKRAHAPSVCGEGRHSVQANEIPAARDGRSSAPHPPPPSAISKTLEPVKLEGNNIILPAYMILSTKETRLCYRKENPVIMRMEWAQLGARSSTSCKGPCQQHIVYNGQTFTSVTKAVKTLLGISRAVNGWLHFYLNVEGRLLRMSDLRDRICNANGISIAGPPDPRQREQQRLQLQWHSSMQVPVGGPSNARPPRQRRHAFGETPSRGRAQPEAGDESDSWSDCEPEANDVEDDEDDESDSWSDCEPEAYDVEDDEPSPKRGKQSGGRCLDDEVSMPGPDEVDSVVLDKSPHYEQSSDQIAKYGVPSLTVQEFTEAVRKGNRTFREKMRTWNQYDGPSDFRKCRLRMVPTCRARHLLRARLCKWFDQNKGLSMHLDDAERESLLEQVCDAHMTTAECDVYDNFMSADKGEFPSYLHTEVPESVKQIVSQQ